MFHFPPFASASYEFRRRSSGITRRGLPHSEIPGSKRICRSPGLIAAYHVLHRLPMPRHSLHALTSLTKNLWSPRLTLLSEDCFPNPYAVFKEPPACAGKCSVDERREAHTASRRPRMVGVTGVEPVTSSLSGTRSNQTELHAHFFAARAAKKWWRQPGSNR
jgi:hypothetical protein